MRQTRHCKICDKTFESGFGKRLPTVERDCTEHSARQLRRYRERRAGKDDQNHANPVNGCNDVESSNDRTYKNMMVIPLCVSYNAPEAD